MPVEIDILYEGDLHTRATHGPSGATIGTDAPTDNGGQGAGFSPTDLVAAALGTCVLTVMGIVAQRNGLDITGTRAHVVKEMVQQPVRRIGALRVTIALPREKAAALTVQDRARLEATGRGCPVHQSLHADVKVEMRFVYTG